MQPTFIAKIFPSQKHFTLLYTPTNTKRDSAKTSRAKPGWRVKLGFLCALLFAMNNAVWAKEMAVDTAIPPALLQDLNAWLDANTEYEKHDRTPDIFFVDQGRAEQLHGVANRSGGRTRGLYDAETETIYLTSPWSTANPRDVSVLLHEMVHHRQSQLHWYCDQAQEWRAYQIQAQWMESQGLDNDFFWPAIILQSSCARRDIHP